jgi:glycosyltransferase involved in cell wall biosynthesis
MNILIISQYFPPEVGAAATRWSEYGQILCDLGHRVTVLTELPNYPSGIIEEGYPKYWFHRDEVQQGKPEVIRVPVWANPRKTTFQRLGFFSSFMLSAMIRSLILPKYDLIIVSSPPLFVGLISTFLRPFKKAHYVLDLRDIWPESAQVLGEIKSANMLAFGRFLERLVYRSVDSFFLAVPGFKIYLNKHHPKHAAKKKLDLINGVSDSFIQMLEDKSQRSKNEQFTVLFSGNIGLAQGLETMLDAAHQLASEPILFQIIGDGAKKQELMQYADSLNLKNVSFLPSMPREQLVNHILGAQICLVPLVKSPLFLNAIPSKMFEYMAAGKPVLVGIKGEVETILAESKAGMSLEPEDAKMLASTILEYADNLERVESEGQAGRAFISSRMTKEVIMSDVLKGLLPND